ncbi:peptide ABC transporter substrate-binding protein [Bradyrhizobium sp. BWA-3-5]|uniref:peptide ABC transporter substrate-binding protein n=1 Tax=Bradyrhizobium sp. BWA-3-5 TaxID=3080013 RepID=UPI00293E889B|nr:peptide ABC transporter substrate-binding protein [Bradyrhizobium sp. BWA-3-5]WOH63715.1 peptide ABC transporter substrate-binding protein [Bradyrhizobium sp. BWA-3-5]
MSGYTPQFTSLDRRAFLALGGGLIAATATGARAQAPAKPSKPTGQIIVGISQEARVLNPLMPATFSDHGLWWAIFDPLWTIDPNGKPLPRLAREVPSTENGGISSDGLNWRIKLRDDVTWHDGKPFTAEDVKFTIELIKSPDFPARTRLGHELVQDIQVISPYEISWKMSKAYSPYISALAACWIIPKHAFDGQNPTTAPFNNEPIGTGPFRWSERVAGNQILLKANTKYYGDGPYVDRVIYKYIPDLNALYAQFQTGQIDYIGAQGILPNFYKDAVKLPQRKIWLSISPGFEIVQFNLSLPIFQDRAVREALYAGINKEVMVDVLNYGLAKPTESILPPSHWAFNPGLPVQKYDPAHANALLDAAGWRLGKGGIRERDGRPLEFSLSSTSGNQLRQQIEQYLMQDWQKIGVSIKIDNKPAAELFGNFFNQSKFEAILLTSIWYQNGDPDFSGRLKSDKVRASGGMNYSFYKNAELDKLLEDGARSFNQDERRAIYQKAEALVRNDLPMLPLFHAPIIEGTKENLIGYEVNVNMTMQTWNIGSWYWAT